MASVVMAGMSIKNTCITRHRTITITTSHCCAKENRSGIFSFNWWTSHSQSASFKEDTDKITSAFTTMEQDRVHQPADFPKKVNSWDRGLLSMAHCQMNTASLHKGHDLMPTAWLAISHNEVAIWGVAPKASFAPKDFMTKKGAPSSKWQMWNSFSVGTTHHAMCGSSYLGAKVDLSAYKPPSEVNLSYEKNWVTWPHGTKLFGPKFI